MIGRIMMGKICFKTNDMLGSERAGAGKLPSMGGKDVMLAGDPDQAQPIADESGHKEGAYKQEGGGTNRRIRGIDIRMPRRAAWRRLSLWASA